jgi:hypothetical protein
MKNEIPPRTTSAPIPIRTASVEVRPPLELVVVVGAVVTVGVVKVGEGVSGVRGLTGLAEPL